MLSGEKNKNIHEPQSETEFPGLIPGHSGWPNHSQMSSPLSSQDNGSSVRWALGAPHQSALYCTVNSVIGRIFLCFPFASTFQYSGSQLTGELGSKDSMKGKNCVQTALLKPLGRYHGRGQHNISRKFSLAQDAPALGPRAAAPRTWAGGVVTEVMERVADSKFKSYFHSAE